jgi:glutamate-ammonia-ligase adenylyltransferase
MQELSTVAEACVQIALEMGFKHIKMKEKRGRGIPQLENHFCIMALGKLGGNELNYSSDIDLIGVWDPLTGSGEHKDRAYHELKESLTHVMEHVISDLSLHTDEGYTYRVDLRLRPFGNAGELVTSVSGLIHYYSQSASLWEIQAALKLRPIAGNQLLGYDFLKRLRPILLKPRESHDIIKSIEKMRNAALQANEGKLTSTIDVKSGMGGLRDLEFMVQGLQLMYAPEQPLLYEGNTLLAMELLSEAGIFPVSRVGELKSDYLFLRRTEHFLQLLEDRQIHFIPKDEKELVVLAKRMLGVEARTDQFMDQLEGCLSRVRDAYAEYLKEKGK